MVAFKKKDVEKTDDAAETVTAGDLQPGNNGFAKDHLISFVERIERLTEEVDAISDDRKEVYSEAKSMGFDTGVLRKVMQRRKKNAADVQEADAILDLYESAIRDAEKKKLAQSIADGE